MLVLSTERKNDKEEQDIQLYTLMVVQIVVQGHTFSVDSRYKPETILGRGSFGVVCTAHDNVTNKSIAIKRIRPYANDDWDARHTLREIRLMRLFKTHPNIISLYNLSSFDEKAELYMMMELMDCDLHRIIQSKQDLSDAHIKCFAKQLLEGIRALHSVGVFHRDIKPGNILVSKDCQLRITDFGLARFMDDRTLNGDNSRNPMTEYVVTRWYRCPELLLAPNRPYTAAVDIWSIGCILGELIRRKPMFPGKSHTHQVQVILEVRGYSSPPDLGFPLSAETKTFLNRRCVYPGQSLTSFIPGASRESIELIDAMLQLSPDSRPSAEEALRYRYLTGAQEVCDYSSVQLFRPDQSMFSFETEKYSLAELRAMIMDEIRETGDEESPVTYTLEGKLVDSDETKQEPLRTMSARSDSNVDSDEAATVSRTRSKFSELMRNKSHPQDRYNSSNYDFPMADVSSMSDDQSGSFLPSTKPGSRDLSSRESITKPIQPENKPVSSKSRSIVSQKSFQFLPKPPQVTERKIGSIFGAQSDASSNNAPVRPSPQKINAIIEKDRRIKRRFFLQSLLSSKQKGAQINPYGIKNKSSEVDFGDLARERIPSSDMSIITHKPSLISAIRGSLGIGMGKKTLFHGAVPIPK